jgi:hypothetical protein
VQHFTVNCIADFVIKKHKSNKINTQSTSSNEGNNVFVGTVISAAANLLGFHFVSRYKDGTRSAKASTSLDPTSIVAEFRVNGYIGDCFSVIFATINRC